MPELPEVESVRRGLVSAQVRAPVARLSLRAADAASCAIEKPSHRGDARVRIVASPESGCDTTNG